MTTSDEHLLDAEADRVLKAAGFDPGIAVYEIDSCGMVVDELRAALFWHHWDEPQPQLLIIRECGSGLRIPTMVTSVTLVFESTEGKPLPGALTTPDYYVVGRPVGTIAAAAPTEIRAHFEGGLGGELGRVYVQEVSSPSGVDPSTRLQYASEY